MRQVVLRCAVVGAGLALALGVWADIHAEQSASVMAEIQAGLAMLIGCNLLLFLWLWYRARPGSGGAMVAPVMALSMAFMLVGILPRVLWPAADGLHLAGSIASMSAMIVLLIVQIRRRRNLRRRARPV
jgi:cytochrome bd-type quinol oxidase subunit 2